MFKIVMVFILVFFVYDSIAQAASAEQIKKELHDTGFVMGYAGACIKKSGRKYTEVEAKECGQRIGQKYKKWGAKVSQYLLEGAHLGMLAWGSEKGKRCQEAIKSSITIMESYGLTGKDYRPFLVPN